MFIWYVSKLMVFTVLSLSRHSIMFFDTFIVVLDKPMPSISQCSFWRRFVTQTTHSTALRTKAVSSISKWGTSIPFITT